MMNLASVARIFALCSFVLLYSCNMNKDIDVPLPGYEKQPVIEAYVIKGNKFRVLLTQTSSYFDSPLPVPIKGATVIFTHNGQTDTLQELTTLEQQYDTATSKFYNYQLNKQIAPNPGDQFALMVNLADGKTITGTSTFLNAVPIDTIKFTGDGDDISLAAYYHDPAHEENYYRFLVHKNTPEGNLEDDDLGSDRLNNGKYNSFYTSDKFKHGDTLVVTLYSIEKAYYDFIRTVEDADNANGNPFAQPATIQSTVTGGLGVFTSLPYHRRVVIIP